MNARLVEEIANAVLYEGYILYPYRASALKNLHRFNFGVVAPRDDASASSGGERSALGTECLVRAVSTAKIRVRVRCLQIVARTVCRLIAGADDDAGDRPPAYEEVNALDVDGSVVRGWQEAVEREMSVAVCSSALQAGGVRQRLEWPAGEDIEPVSTADGRHVGAIVRRRAALQGELLVSGERAGKDCFKIAVEISNATPASFCDHAGRDGWLMRSLVSTHAILQVEGGEFLSLLDPPDEARDEAAACRQAGLWPVLVGAPSDRDALLASPIILYDYPQIAPESAGDFCDGTEIDEMLALRILTMTDAEKLEMRQGDERGRRMLERTESLSDEQMIRLHGVLRGLRSVDGEGAR